MEKLNIGLGSVEIIAGLGYKKSVCSMGLMLGYA